MRISAKITAESAEKLNSALQHARHAGCEGVEFSWPEIRQSLGSFNPASAIGEILARNQLVASNVELSPLAITDESRLCEMVASLREQMMQVRQISPGLVSIKAGPRRQQSLDLCVLALNAILPTAEELELTIALANAYDTRIEQLEDWRYILPEVRHPRLGALIDCGEFHAAAVNPRDALREIGDLAKFIRIDDRIGRRAVPLGEGEMNVQAIREHLHRIDYLGWVEYLTQSTPATILRS